MQVFPKKEVQTTVPRPSKRDCFKRLLNLSPKIPITSVVDVGVDSGTSELIEMFPNLKHYLFECFFANELKIKKKYHNIQNELFLTALGGQNSEQYLNVVCLDQSKTPTHCHIAPRYTAPDNSLMLSSNKILVHRFDSLPIANTIEDNFLLKIDTDGTEDQILEGFGTKLNSASIIVVESVMSKIASLSTFLINNGFILMEIVDICYYKDFPWQVDLVFLRKDLHLSSYQLDWKAFDAKYWHQVN